MIVSTDGFFNAILEPNLIMTLIVPIKCINESTGFSETEHFAWNYLNIRFNWLPCRRSPNFKKAQDAKP